MKQNFIIIAATVLLTASATIGLFLMTKAEAEIVVNNSEEFKIGTVQLFMGSSIPSGYLLCDGKAISRTAYASLFAVIGTTYGAGDGSTTFNLPNFQGKTPVGKNSGTFNTLGKTGGEETHKITASELPSHTHYIPSISGTTSTDGAHRHQIGMHSAWGTMYGWMPINPAEVKIAYRDNTTGSSEAGSHSHTFTTNASTSGSSGSGTAMNNLQPYSVGNYIIKY